jgi:hypothetical protein
MIYWKTKILCFSESKGFYYRNPPYIRVGDVAVMINAKTLSFNKRSIVSVGKIRNARGFRVRTSSKFVDAHPVNYFVVRRPDGLVKLLRLSEIRRSDEFVFKMFKDNGANYMIAEPPISVIGDSAYSRFYDVVVDHQQSVDIFVANHFLLGVLRKAKS